MGMAPFISPSQGFVQDPTGKPLQHFLTTLVYNFAIPSYDYGVYHRLILLNPATRVLDYKPLHTNKKEGGFTTIPQEPPDQVLVQNSRGKTYALLFYPGELIAGNLTRHTVQLHLPPPEEPKADTTDQVQAEAITKVDKTKGLASKIQATLTGPRVATTEHTTTISSPPAMATAKPSPKPSHDPNISLGATGTAANQLSPPPQQSRGEGRNKVKKSLTVSTPSRSKPTAPTLEDNRDRSRDTLGMGAKGPIKDTVTPPTPDSVDTDRTSGTGGEGLSQRKWIGTADFPMQTPKGTVSQAQERGKEHNQIRIGERTTRTEANIPIATSASNILLSLRQRAIRLHLLDPTRLTNPRDKS